MTHRLAVFLLGTFAFLGGAPAVTGQTTLKGAYKRCGLMVAAPKERLRGTLGAVTSWMKSLGTEATAFDKVFRKETGDFTVHRQQMKNGFEVEFFQLASNGDERGLFRRHIEKNFKDHWHLTGVNRATPLAILYEQGSKRSYRTILRVWQTPRYNKKEIGARIETALRQHYLEENAAKLLRAAKAARKATELTNAILLCERAQKVQSVPAEVRDEARTILEACKRELEENARKRLVKTDEGWRKERTAPTAARSSKRKGPGVKVKAGFKTKHFHDFLSLVYPDTRTWRDQEPYVLGARLEHGVLMILYTSFAKAPQGGTRTLILLNGKKFASTNTSKWAKELQRKWQGDFKKVYRSTKARKIPIQKGKAVAFDMVVSGGKGDGVQMIERFTRIAASIDATRSYNPRDIKMHVRAVIVSGKAGTHVLELLATEGVLKKHRREIDKVLRSISAS